MNARESKQVEFTRDSFCTREQTRKTNVALSEGVACKTYEGAFAEGEGLGVGKHPSVPRPLSCGHYLSGGIRQSQDAFSVVSVFSRAPGKQKYWCKQASHCYFQFRPDNHYSLMTVSPEGGICLYVYDNF